jgi:hypothetical protein
MFDGPPWETRAIVKKLDEHGETGVSVDVKVCSGIAAWCGATRSGAEVAVAVAADKS